MYSQSKYNNVGKTNPPSNSFPCFTCKKTGHWYRNCPEKSPVKNPGKGTSPNIITTNEQYPRALRCRCGSGDCSIRTSNSEDNPNRNYYICPGTTSDKECGYFKWCDRVTEDEFKNPPLYRFPECICRAGICFLEQVRGGPNDGRKLFVCRIPKGDGACSFSQMFDPQRDIVKYGEAENINLNTPPSLENQSNSDFSKDENVSLVVSQENICGSIIENNLKSSLLTSQAVVCSLQTEFRSQVSFAEGVYTNLESEQLDTTFPCTPKQGARISSDDFRYTNGSQQTNLMEVSISETIRLAALTIQNNLIKLLDSMDILDQEDMVRASESAFSVLDQLGFESTPFSASVMEFIECSSQAAIAMLICDDLSSSQKLEQEQLEIHTCTHAELMSEFKTSKERLGLLKNELLQIERQVSDCEAETNNLKSRVAGISEKMAMSEKRLEAASMEASKIREQMEVERRAAKAALEKAKLQLRQ